ncbi:Thiazole biosynthesis ThiH [Erwinia tracheiphila PSU-1]|nr:Thiazole biosynthesis ThiH [Erwinia tracheiphila PSU-1]
MGYLQTECAQGKEQFYQMTCELPSLSRLLYECMLTGVTPINIHSQRCQPPEQRAQYFSLRARLWADRRRCIALG